MRLIDADELQSITYPMEFAEYIGEDTRMVEIVFKSAVDGAPTIDAVPVVRGEWEVAIGYDPNKKVQCQNCYKMAYEPTPYCPNCGAKMEDKP